MPKFNYVAMDNQGKEQKGVIEADNQNDAGSKLKEQNLFPTSIAEVKGSGGGGKTPAAKGKAKSRKTGKGLNLNISFGGGKIKVRQLTVFTRQLATLLDAGLPLVRSLRTLERQSKDPALNRILGEVANTVEGGLTFSEALAMHPKSFSKLYINMVKAGEASGAMEQVLNRLSEFLEKSQKLKAKIKSALTYPLVVLFIAVTITLGLMIFIVPKFAKIFTEMLAGEPLPMLTQFVMGISNFLLTRAIHGVIGGIVFGFIFVWAKRTRIGSLIFDTVMYKTPPLGSLVQKSSVAQFCSTLGTLMSSGVSVLQALVIVRDTSTNQVVAKAVQTIHDAVKEGEGMTKPLEETQVFPPMVVSMIEVGEETGALPEMLQRVSKTYEEEVDMAVEAMTSMIEPIMIVFLAVIIGGIVIALFLPLIKLMDTLAQ